MASSSDRVRVQSSRWVATCAGVLLALCLFMVTPATAQVPDAAAALGIGDTHGSLSFAPLGQTDTYAGNGLLSFSELDEPGNAGFTPW